MLQMVVIEAIENSFWSKLEVEKLEEEGDEDDEADDDLDREHKLSAEPLNEQLLNSCCC